ncbi:anthranilate phosphoribosyltransferase [Tumebacillus sp. DT12]|uniref:Anthranilate phosphoribosyltransferase n=1 Tax=Tumebacillus lacus TaxID=2995335 RepID=A0ABT3X462_9BACL|nr:anthranilate phosphoribosyltransferase [Tumebacillus lacus]MCX7570762.1 anthranilate phosphoribosyltransferase [Tumebacillus lacus]
MQTYLKEVGRGKKGARDLSYEEALYAAARIADREATDAQIGAFFMAERMKGESVTELRAFVEVLRARTERVDGVPDVLDCAGPYDGRAKSFAATIPVAAVLASAGVPVALHGTESLPPKDGVSLLEILRELGVSAAASVDQAKNTLLQTGLAFMETESWCAPLDGLRQIREGLGVRTMLNTAEKFLNLAGAEWQVTGVFHTSAMDKAAELMKELGYRKGMVVQGIDGSEDIPTHRPSAVLIVRDGEAEKHLIDPKEYGLSAEVDAAGWSAKEQAERILDVLSGEEQALGKMVVLNSALRLWLTERVDSVAAGADLAREALDSGRAKEKFMEWRG